MISPTVSTLSIIFMCITLLICFGLPIALAVSAKLKYRKAFSLIPLLAGVVGFFVSQQIFRMPVLGYALPLFGWYKQLMNMQWFYLLFLCFTAGLVEEPARFIAFTIMKKRRSYTDGLSYGIGHGGIEAMLLVGMTYISNLIIALMINSGLQNVFSSPVLSKAISALTVTPPYMFLVGGIERLFTVIFHIALTLVVLKGFQKNKKLLYLFISFMIHGLFNFIAIGLLQINMTTVTLTSQLRGIIATESFMAIVAILSVIFIVKQAKAWRKAQQTAEIPEETDTGVKESI